VDRLHTYSGGTPDLILEREHQPASLGATLTAQYNWRGGEKPLHQLVTPTADFNTIACQYSLMLASQPPMQGNPYAHQRRN
jgi:hypothetical protein